MSDEQKAGVTNGSAEASSSPDSDKDLDALLNSALEDFDKPAPTAAAAVSVTEVGAEELVTVSGTGDATDATMMDSKWTEEFIKQAAAQFEQNMQSLMGVQTPAGGNLMEGLADLRPEQLGENFQKIAEAAARAIGEDTNDGDFTSAISQTLRNLSEGAENLQTPLSDEDMMNMFGGLNMSEPGESSDFLPFMQNMMQSLLSKEILYPALKDIVDKYPAWLEEKTSSLDSADLQRYTTQKDLMTEVCKELEQESPGDSSETKKLRFSKILELMQKMQDCGQPPPDLVGDLGSVVNFDPQGNPSFPGMNFAAGADPSSCALM